MEEENHDRKVLRNKMVSFMYLIFIVLAFIYIPSDFIDTIKGIDSSLSLSSKEINQAKNYNLLLVNAGLAADTTNKLNNEGEHFLRISKLTDSVCNELNIIKQQVLSVSGGLNSYGYLRNAKDNQFTDKIMLANGAGLEIKLMLENYKKEISNSGVSITQKMLDTIIPTNSKVITSKGELVEWEKFHFYKMPLTVSLALISKFQNDIKAVESMAMNEYLERFQKKFDLKAVDKNIIKRPEIKLVEEKPQANSRAAFGRADEYNILYKDIDNALTIYHPFLSVENMKLVATGGAQVFKKGDVFYVRHRDEGTIEISAYSADGNTLVITQKFHVRSLPEPAILMANRKGGKIAYKIMRVQKNLEIRNDFVKNLIDYTFKDFTVLKIGADSKASPVIENKGAFFNAATKELIDNANKGDTYIFDNISITTPYGTNIKVSPVIFTVN